MTPAQKLDLLSALHSLSHDAKTAWSDVLNGDTSTLHHVGRSYAQMVRVLMAIDAKATP
jgi:hypothetical protein